MLVGMKFRIKIHAGNMKKGYVDCEKIADIATLKDAGTYWKQVFAGTMITVSFYIPKCVSDLLN